MAARLPFWISKIYAVHNPQSIPDLGVKFQTIWPIHSWKIAVHRSMYGRRPSYKPPPYGLGLVMKNTIQRNWHLKLRQQLRKQQENWQQSGHIGLNVFSAIIFIARLTFNGHRFQTRNHMAHQILVYLYTNQFPNSGWGVIFFQWNSFWLNIFVLIKCSLHVVEPSAQIRRIGTVLSIHKLGVT